MFTHFKLHFKAVSLFKLFLALIAACAFLLHATASSDHPYTQEIPQRQSQVAIQQSAQILYSTNGSASSRLSSQTLAYKDDLWAIAYTPYTSTGACKLPSEIQTDVARIAAAGFSAIRLYSTDCSILPTITPLARTHSVSLLLGLHLSSCSLSHPSTTEQLHDILTFSDWPLTALIVLGNESIFNGICTAPALAALLDSLTARLRAAGYSGPITTTEPLSVVYEHAELLCPRVDVLAANIQPYFHPRVTAKDAGRFVGFQLLQLAKVCGGADGEEEERRVLNLETGWPSAGVANGLAEAGREEQRVAIESVRSVAGARSVFASYEDATWMTEDGESGIEGHWGCIDVFET